MTAPDGEPPASDADLLRAHVAGDPWAFQALARRHEALLWTVARRLLDDRQDAADAVQDAFLRAHAHARSYRGESSVRTWLVAIARNTSWDRHRQRRARPEPVAGPEALERLPGPRDPISDREVSLDVDAALRRIPLHLREAVMLIHMHGFSLRDASLIVGVPPGTVKTRAHRGRERLRPLLAQLVPPPPALTAPEER